MILNPIQMLFLTGLSLVGGAFIWTQTDDGLSSIPFVFFIFLFCLSLLIPVVKKAQLVVGFRVARRALIQVIKLPGERFSAFGHYGARHLVHKRFEMDRARRAKSIVDG